VSAPRPTAPRGLASGALLVLAGLVCWVLYVVQSGHEAKSYAHGGPPPNYVQLKAGHTYGISIPDGVNAEAREGLDPSALHCTASVTGEAPGALAVVAEHSDSKAIDQIGSFVAALNASEHIDCTGIGSVYVDGAEDAGTDWSGTWLVLAMLALAIGIPLALSGLRAGPTVPATPDDSAHHSTSGPRP
jgi:hypothetical protein